MVHMMHLAAIPLKTQKKSIVSFKALTKNVLKEDLLTNQAKICQLKQQLAVTKEDTRKTFLKEALIDTLEKRLDLTSRKGLQNKRLSALKVFAQYILPVLVFSVSVLLNKPLKKVLKQNPIILRAIYASAIPGIIGNFILENKNLKHKIKNALLKRNT
jgi:hypothetical protein